MSLISQADEVQSSGPWSQHVAVTQSWAAVTPGLHPPVISVSETLQHCEGLGACTDFGRKKLWQPTKMHHFELIYKNLDRERVHLIERCNYQVLEAKGLINF